MFQRIPQKKGSLPLYGLLLIAATFALMAVRQCSIKTLPPMPDDIAGGDTINVAIEISPMGVYTTGDTLCGHYYNLLRDLTAANGRAVRFHPFTRLETALAGLEEGKYQIVVSDIPATTHLKNRYIFLQPGEIDRQVLVQLKDSVGTVPLKSQFNLGGAHVTVPKGSPFISRLRNLSHEIGDTIYIDENPTYSTEQLIIMTALGEIPNVVASARLAKPLLERYPNLDASLSISFNQFQGWAMMPRDSLLRDTIARWIELYPLHHSKISPKN